MFRVVICIILLFIYMLTVVDQLPRMGKRELICLQLFTCNYLVAVWRGFLFLWVLGMGFIVVLPEPSINYFEVAKSDSRLILFTNYTQI